VDTLQPPFSAIRREFAAAELPWCVAHETGVIVYSPMQAGLLTGAFTQARAEALPPDDWRSRNGEFTGERLKRNLQLVDAMKSVGKRHGTTAAAVAIAWTLAWPGVTGAIVGARAPEQIDGWLDAATLNLGPADMEDIAAAIAATGAGSGPALPPDTAG
jgi:aryl-alcohol dehydrogenase-like predicted oxidoreductase